MHNLERKVLHFSNTYLTGEKVDLDKEGYELLKKLLHKKGYSEQGGVYIREDEKKSRVLGIINQEKEVSPCYLEILKEECPEVISDLQKILQAEAKRFDATESILGGATVTGLIAYTVFVGDLLLAGGAGTLACGGYIILSGYTGNVVGGGFNSIMEKRRSKKTKKIKQEESKAFIQKHPQLILGNKALYKALH